MLSPSATQRSDDFVGMAIPTVPVRSPPPVASVVSGRPQPALVNAVTTASAPTIRPKLLRIKFLRIVFRPENAVGAGPDHGM
ncbi:hypothetical protein GCM10010409_19870 [Mycolicibacterium diernhoferi]